jgi:hypothetical protein
MNLLYIRCNVIFLLQLFQGDEQPLFVDVLEPAVDVLAQVAPGQRWRRSSARPQHLPDPGEIEFN